MFTLLILAALDVPQIGRFYFTDPDRGAPAILPALALPRVAGGFLPAPNPPSDRSFGVKTGRGEVAMTRVLFDEMFDPVRVYPNVGPARCWRLTYRIKIIEPGGKVRVVYVDRHALVRTP